MTGDRSSTQGSKLGLRAADAPPLPSWRPTQASPPSVGQRTLAASHFSKGLASDDVTATRRVRTEPSTSRSR